MGTPAAEPVDVWARVGVGTRWLVAAEGAGCGRLWARVGVGTRWLVAVEDAGCGRRGHQGGESFTPFAPDYGNNHSSCHGQLFLSGHCLDSRVIQQVVDFCCVKRHNINCFRHAVWALS